MIGFRRPQTRCPGLSTAKTNGRAFDQTQSGRPQWHSGLRHRVSRYFRTDMLLSAHRKAPLGVPVGDGNANKALEQLAFNRYGFLFRAGSLGPQAAQKRSGARRLMFAQAHERSLSPVSDQRSR